MTSRKEECPGLTIQTENQKTPYMLQLFSDQNHAIDYVADKKHGCKYVLTDGLTAVKALYARQCGKLVETGRKSFPTQQGYIAPLNMEKSFVDEISREIFHLSETSQLESLEDYKSKKDPKCTVQESSSIDFTTLRVFFICAYGTCVVFLVHMFIDPQRDDPDDEIDDFQSGALNNADDDDEEDEDSIRKVNR